MWPQWRGEFFIESALPLGLAKSLIIQLVILHVTDSNRLDGLTLPKPLAVGKYLNKTIDRQRSAVD